ncbi:MAG: winged helix-turn-helix transcriptional regulator [Alphaproteobacteria bacterium]|nr:winged helix-turn-helix transcriptional regulator [Alphaproteobacteria bacterium]
MSDKLQPHCHHCEKIEDIMINMPNAQSFERASETFQLISDPARLRILWLLCHREVCVNNIAYAVNMSAPAVSHHLRLLKHAGFLTSRRDGKEMLYRLSSSPEAGLVHKAVDDILNITCPA